VEIELGKVQLPHFEVPDGFDGNSYLRHLAEAGLIKRYGKSYQEIDAVYRERLDYELSVIERMGWPSYFLIVADFVNWAKDNKIVVGPGRGSAAGSLVCYSLGITNICPIKYELLFERFLNPDRISMPDIDMDFADIRRDDVIKYVQEKYGYDHVAQIITFGTMAARAAIRDVGRVLYYPYDFCDRLAKAVPMFMTLAKTLAEVAEFQ
jgi:DNA polymerase-3 subunit alpha